MAELNRYLKAGLLFYKSGLDHCHIGNRSVVEDLLQIAKGKGLTHADVLSPQKSAAARIGGATGSGDALTNRGVRAHRRKGGPQAKKAGARLSSRQLHFNAGRLSNRVYDLFLDLEHHPGDAFSIEGYLHIIGIVGLHGCGDTLLLFRENPRHVVHSSKI